LAITVTELKLIAAAASIGNSSQPAVAAVPATKSAGTTCSKRRGKLEMT
jgi:hypothetical protein